MDGRFGAFEPYSDIKGVGEMTVKELIKLLEKYPEHRDVYYWDVVERKYVTIYKVFLDDDGDVNLSRD